MKRINLVSALDLHVQVMFAYRSGAKTIIMFDHNDIITENISIFQTLL